MALFEWMSRKKKPASEPLDAYLLGRQHGDALYKHLKARANTFTDGRFSLMFSRYVDGFSQRLDTVYDDPHHEPKLVASMQLKIFNDEADKAKSSLRSEFETYMLSEDELILGLLEDEETMKDIKHTASQIMESALEDGFELLKNTAVAMYESKIDEIEKRASAR